jgi:hypothetical protein
MATLSFTVRAQDNVGASSLQNFSVIVQNTRVENIMIVDNVSSTQCNAYSSPDGGNNWTTRPGMGGDGVIYGSSLWLTYNTATNKINTSPDGVFWTTVTLSSIYGISNFYSGVQDIAFNYTNNMFISSVSYYSGGTINYKQSYSANGTSWAPMANPLFPVDSVIYASSLYYTVNNNAFYYTNNLANGFTASGTIASAGNLVDIMCLSGNYIALDSMTSTGYNCVWTSNNLTLWYKRTLPALTLNNYWYPNKLAYGNGRLIITGKGQGNSSNNGTQIPTLAGVITSDNGGLTWTTCSIPGITYNSNNYITYFWTDKITNFNGTWYFTHNSNIGPAVATGVYTPFSGFNNNSIQISTSPDAITWPSLVSSLVPATGTSIARLPQ